MRFDDLCIIVKFSLIKFCPHLSLAPAHIHQKNQKYIKCTLFVKALFLTKL